MSQLLHSGGARAGIGNPVTDGDPGSVLHVDASGNLAEDNANLFWDLVDKALRLGDNAISVGTLSIRPPANDERALVLKGKTSAASAVDPATLSPTLYLNVNDLVLNDNDPVATWGNAGSTNDFTASGSARPTYKANGGDPYVQFDGTDDFMASTSQLDDIREPDAYTVFAVFQADSIGTNNATTWTNDAILHDSSSFWGLHLKSTNNVLLYSYDGADETVSNAINLGEFYILDGYKEGSSIFARLNADPYGTLGNNANNGGGTGTMELGRGAGSAYANIKLKALIVFNSTLSESNRLGVSKFLADTFSLTGGGNTGQTVNLAEAYDVNDTATFAIDKDGNIVAGDTSSASALQGFLRYQRANSSSDKYIQVYDENGKEAFAVDDNGSIRGGSANTGLSTPALFLGGFNIFEVTSGTTLTLNAAGYNNFYINKKVGINNNAPLTEGTQLFVVADAAGTKGVTVKAAASQTADLIQVKDSSNNVRFSVDANALTKLMADQTTDTAPNDDTSLKKLTLQKLASPPTNAAYIPFQNNPGSDTFYLVLEEG